MAWQGGDRLPLLAADRPSVISVFVSDTSDNRVVEVKSMAATGRG